MRRSRSLVLLMFTAACCCLLAASLAHAQAQAQAQAQQKPTYEPQVGQEGKDVVWVPTGEALVQKMLDLANVTPADFVMDLGSGDGRTVIAAAKRGARAVGVEFNPDMVELSQANAVKAGVTDRATFLNGDLFETDLSRATVITMFLLPSINMKLRPKILDLKPGTRIVSNSFNMEDWVPDEQETITGDCSSWCTALFWVVPAKVEGAWKMPQGTLRLTQTFQIVSGTLDTASASVPVTDGRLRGTEISFTVNGTRYAGRVNGTAMTGTAGANGSWSATRINQ